MKHTTIMDVDLPLAVLDVIPNPVLVKNARLEYVWVNQAFEALFSVARAELIGRLDIDVFPDRQSAQCNGGDRRVLADGAIDEAYETVFTSAGEPRETLTRKSRLDLPSGAQFLVGVMHDLTDMTRAQTRLQEQATALELLANTDGLTGCLNRRALSDMVATDKRKTTGQAGVMLLDLDRFKSVNDTHGHAVGDGVLIQFCDAVRKVIRDCDVLARLGGEEFVVYMPDTSQDALMRMSRRICQFVAATAITVDAVTIPQTVSIGAAVSDATGPVDLPALLARADAALYQVKSNGRNGAALG